MAWNKLTREQKDKINTAKQDRRNKRRDFIREQQKIRGACSECGFNHPAALEWHHLDPSVKEREVSKLAVSYHTEEEILKEIEKCIILCANCHRILHWNDRRK